MSEKKIAECINVRINVGNYQHIELTKYAEKTITYNNPEEMVKKEDELTDELVTNLIRNMRQLPDRLGKKTNAVAEVEESISKAIPDWLKNGDVPNIANNAKKEHNSTVSEQKEQKDAKSEVTGEAAISKKRESKPVEKPVEKTTATTDDLDLFDEDLFGEEKD